MGPQFREIVYIYEVNRAKKVKSDAQVQCSHEQELEPRSKTVSSGVAGEDGAPNSDFSKLPELSETSRARKLIFGLQVNIEYRQGQQSQISRFRVDGTWGLTINFSTHCLSLKSFD